MRTLIAGTAGHIDHGKTALVRALTGIETDRLPDEKRRGITIDLGFAHLQLGDFALGFVDVPGHEGFVRNMLAGATGFDLVVLAIAADEGVMPQTREHLAIIELLGIGHGIVALTESDLVDPEWLDLVQEEVHEVLAATSLRGAPIIPVSVVTGHGLPELRAALTAAASAAAPRRSNDLFRMPIDRVFSVRGTGTVVTGTVWGGQLSEGDVARVLPSDLSIRSRGLQVHGRPASIVSAGQRAAVALAGVPHEDVARGDVLVSHASWAPASIVTVRIRVTADAAAPLRTRQRVRFHLGTVERLARVALFARDELKPGEEAWAQLRLELPIIARAGDRFVIRTYSPVTTVAGGTVAEPRAPKRRGITPQDAVDLAAVLGGSAPDALSAAVRLAGAAGVTTSEACLVTPFAPEALQPPPPVVQVVGERLFSSDLAEAARSGIQSGVDIYHRKHPLRQGVARDELRHALPRSTNPQLGAWAIDSLLSEGALVSTSGVIRRRGFVPTLSAEQASVRDQLLQAFDHGGLAPPSIGDLPQPLKGHPDLWRILKLLEHEARIIPVAPDLYFDKRHLSHATGHIVAELGGRSGLGPADFKAVLSVSRKYLIPVLEYLDARGVTVRQGDTRSVPQAKLPPEPATPMLL